MKKQILFAGLFLPLAALAQQNFSVNGSIKDLPTGTKVYLSYKAGGKSVTDSAVTAKGAFTFKGKLTEPVRGNLFRTSAPKTKRDALALFLEPTKISINAVDSLKNAKITGSAVNADNERLKSATDPILTRLNAISESFSKLTPEERKDKTNAEARQQQYATVNAELSQAYLDFAKANPKSYISLSSLMQIAGKEDLQPAAETAFLALNTSLRTTKTGTDVAGILEATKKTKIGLDAINFTQNDVNGKAVSLSDFKGKYVLVDFWASWCGPCRRENPNVVIAYNRFKDKGFTVLGVSLDQPGKKEDWLKAIADDHLDWTQVSDLQFWDNAVAKLYGIRSIPANYLIDPSGKIIAKGLRGEDLTAKLSSLLETQAK